MKKNILLFLLTFPFWSYSQTPFPTINYINANKINAGVLVHGDMWWNPSDQLPRCEFPKGSGKHISFASSLWMGGYDASNNLHVSSQTYRQDGNDYWPGPIDSTDSISYLTSRNWASIWSVRRSDINTFLALSSHDSASTPSSILKWPGKGNIYAKGFANARLNVTSDMAPFVDLNHNGIYEPLLGEYPDFYGEQGLWWVFNDKGPTHNNSNGQPLGVEVHASAFEFVRGTLIDNVVYYSFELWNKSTNDYTNFRLGQWADIDLGYYMDDYIGFDSAHRMGFAYNGLTDDGITVGHTSGSYDTMIPISGVTMIVLPDDYGTTIQPAGSFIVYQNDSSSEIGNPTSAAQYNNYLRAKTRSGMSYKNDFRGAGIHSDCYSSGTPTNYVFTGRPGDTTQWSECTCNNVVGDRRFVISSNDFTLHAGEKKKIVMALVTTNRILNNGCPSMGNFDSLLVVADTAWQNFHSLPPLGTPTIAVAPQPLKIFPNPAHNIVYIQSASNINTGAKVEVYNTLGKLFDVTSVWNNNRLEVNLETLPSGMYIIRYTDVSMQQNLLLEKY